MEKRTTKTKSQAKEINVCFNIDGKKYTAKDIVNCYSVCLYATLKRYYRDKRRRDSMDIYGKLLADFIYHYNEAQAPVTFENRSVFHTALLSDIQQKFLFDSGAKWYKASKDIDSLRAILDGIEGTQLMDYFSEFKLAGSLNKLLAPIKKEVATWNVHRDVKLLRRIVVVYRRMSKREFSFIQKSIYQSTLRCYADYKLKDEQDRQCREQINVKFNIGNKESSLKHIIHKYSGCLYALANKHCDNATERCSNAFFNVARPQALHKYVSWNEFVEQLCSFELADQFTNKQAKNECITLGKLLMDIEGTELTPYLRYYKEINNFEGLLQKIKMGFVGVDAKKKARLLNEIISLYQTMGKEKIDSIITRIWLEAVEQLKPDKVAV